MPELSVIMGVFNTPKSYIDKAINSVLNQTFTDFEFIICNDGCTDDTFNYIRHKYNDNRIVWLENESNRGLAYTLNNCLSYVCGKYVARMDTDDYSREKRFQVQIDYLRAHEDVGVANCNIYVFDDNGVYGERKASEDISIKDFLFSNPIIHPAVMISKKALDRVGGYRDIDMTFRNEDYDMFLRMISKGIKMHTIQEVLFEFREDKDTISRRKYKYRINEYLIKCDNFKKMGMLPKYYLYCLKPLVVGLLPSGILKLVRNK